MGGGVEGGGGPIVLVSNRGPIQFGLEADGRRVRRRGAGGLVTALEGVTARLVDEDSVWVCSAMTDEDVAVAREQGGRAVVVEEGDRRRFVRMVELDPDAYRKFYAVIANPMLWFIQHGLWDLSHAPNITATEKDAFVTGYDEVNRRFAEVVAEEVGRHGGAVTVMSHDYHFYLLAPRVRERCPHAFLHHFVHIPWPQPDSWRTLPAPLREQLLEGLLSNDVVAFHTERYARNFLLTCQELLDLPVRFSDLSVEFGGRRVAARWYPISIDVAELEAAIETPAVLELEQRLENSRREFLILRVDRADLSKNILRGFLAFDALLEGHPDLVGRVTFLALVQPSRQDVDEYVDYAERVRRMAADINLKHGHSEWQPIDLRFEDNLPQALAAYRLYDVLLVNPVVDGMNLVAKEGVLANRRDGVLVLSEHAGAYEELGAFVVPVHPFDVCQQADALYRAITMDPTERRELHRACVEVVRANNLDKWFRAQLADIEALRNAR
ncbi:MAG: trehalose-6-phosphate synthase [Acidimicrobiales bacterium]|nr:trehalose-6-phosphate synthase [Acidimicrobiales bacterium]